MAFFDVKVLKPNAKRFVNQDISKIYELTEKKKRLYNVRITEIEYEIEFYYIDDVSYRWNGSRMSKILLALDRND